MDNPRPEDSLAPLAGGSNISTERDGYLFNPFDPEEHIEITYSSHLPHWEQIGATYFVTWRTRDSMPEAVVEDWIQSRDRWLERNSVATGDIESWPDEKWLQYHLSFSNCWLRELDKCHGECVLRRPDLQSIIEDSILTFQGDRYDVHDFVIMPNHVHVLFTPLSDFPVRAICKSWKKWTAGKINMTLDQNGKFWQADSFDHLVRNERSFSAFSKYIRENPAAATLREGDFRLGP